MKVNITDLRVSMDLGTKGLTIAVYSADGKEYKGRLIIGKAKLKWCKGKTQVKNGVEVTWEKFIETMESK